MRTFLLVRSFISCLTGGSKKEGRLIVLFQPLALGYTPAQAPTERKLKRRIAVSSENDILGGRSCVSSGDCSFSVWIAHLNLGIHCNPILAATFVQAGKPTELGYNRILDQPWCVDGFAWRQQQNDLAFR
jgi:hypothetical protein